MSVKKLYVICNSHMDPIWLWRLREGRSTWLNTCRSVVNIMKKYPMIKFSRSSSVCYKWVEDSDPYLFREIQKLVDAGRWEIVGGWVEQSDTIVTPAESLIRQAEHGNRYFKEKFGRTATIAYSVDAFGQNCGLPKLLNATGFNRYVWMRPCFAEKNMPEIFRWVGDDGVSCVTSFRVQAAYCTKPVMKDRKDIEERIETVMQRGHEDQTFFFGIGDHGGGIYENQLKMLLELSEKYDMEFSTLGDYFDIIEKQELPVVTGEHTHHAPGCYSAVSDIKKDMSRAEKTLFKAEKIVLESAGTREEKENSFRKIDDAWEEILFNYFHDIYPGTSIREPFRKEIRDISGYSIKTATDILEKQLSRYGAAAKTDFLTEGGVLLWNPLPVPVKGIMRFDTYPDPNCTGRCFNILADAEGNTLPLQWCRGASAFGPGGEWGMAAAVVDMPPSGLKVLAYARDDKNRDDLGFARQYALLERLEFQIVNDLFDTWGHGAKELGPTAGSARIDGVEELENGAVVSRLRINCSWNNSSFKADIRAFRDVPELEITVTGCWLEREQDLKIVLKTGITAGSIISGQSGAVLERTPDICEQPFIDWCAAAGNGRYAGFIADNLHSYDSVGTESLRVTLLRPVYYAEHAPNAVTGNEGMADFGEFENVLWFAEGREEDIRREMPARARERVWHVEHLEITGAADGREFCRDEWSVEPSFITVSAMYQNKDGKTEIHLVNPAAEKAEVKICRNGCGVWQDTLAASEMRLLIL